MLARAMLGFDRMRRVTKVSGTAMVEYNENRSDHVKGSIPSPKWVPIPTSTGEDPVSLYTDEYFPSMEEILATWPPPGRCFGCHLLSGRR